MVAHGASTTAPRSGGSQAADSWKEASRNSTTGPRRLHRTTSITSLSNGYASDTSLGALSEPGHQHRLQRSTSRTVYMSSAPFAESQERRPPTPDLARRQTVFRTDSMNRPMTQVTSGLALTEHVPPGRLTPGQVPPRQKTPVHVVRVGKAPSNEQFRPTAQRQSRDVFCSGAPFADGTSRAAKPVQPGQTVFRVETSNGSSKGRAATPNNSRPGVVYPGPPSARSSPMHPAGALGAKGTHGAEFRGDTKRVPGVPRPKTSQGQPHPGAGHANGLVRPGTSLGGKASGGRVGRPSAAAAMSTSKSWTDVTESAKTGASKNLGPSLTTSKSHADVDKPSAGVALVGAADVAEIEKFEDCLLEIDLSADVEQDRLAAAVLPPELEAVHLKPVVKKLEDTKASVKKAESPQAAAKEGKCIEDNGDPGMKKVSSFPWLWSKGFSSKAVKGGPKCVLMEEEGTGEEERPPSRGFNFRVFGARQKAKA